MMGHSKAASCSILPSFTSLSSIHTNQPDLGFPLPSFCLYSRHALDDENALESDIIQFLAPISILQEKLPMFVGVLQSLITVVNDLPFQHDSEESDTEEEQEEEEQEETLFTILGLNTMKLVLWNYILDDICLVVLTSSQYTDDDLLNHMHLIKDALPSDWTTVQELGDQLIPLVDYWFKH